MNFLLEFVCCRCSNPQSSSSLTPQSSGVDETRFLVHPPRRRITRRRKRGRSASGSASAEWQPSLMAISEDCVVAEMHERRKYVGAERMVKRKNDDRVQLRSHSNDFGQASFSTVIPAFSPTPFMF